MIKPQFNTPYLLNTDGYKKCFNVFSTDFKIRPVYMTRRKGNECSISIYSDDMTKELDSYAWISIYELMPYSLDTADEIEDELQEYLDEWEENECIEMEEIEYKEG